MYQTVYFQLFIIVLAITGRTDGIPNQGGPRDPRPDAGSGDPRLGGPPLDSLVASLGNRTRNRKPPSASTRDEIKKKLSEGREGHVESQRAPPGINDDGTLDIIALNPRVVATLIAMEIDLGVDDERTKALLCGRMFKTCAHPMFMENMAEYGVDCFPQELPFEQRAGWILEGMKCGEDYMAKMTVINCADIPGDDQFTCLGDYASEAVSGDDIKAKIESGEFNARDLDSKSRKEAAKAFAKEGRVGRGRLSAASSAALIGQGLGEDLPNSDRRNMDLSSVTDRDAYKAMKGMHDLRRKLARDAFSLDTLFSSEAGSDAATEAMEVLGEVFADLDDDTMRKLPADLVIQLLMSHSGDMKNKTKAESTNMAKRMRKSSNFDPSSLLKTPGTASVMRKEEIEGLTRDQIVEAIDVESGNKIDPSKKRQLARQVEGNRDFSQITTAEFAEDAALLGGLSLESFRDIPGDILMGSLSVNPKAINDRPAACDSTREALETSGESACSMVKNGITKCLTPKHIESCTASEMGLDGQEEYTHPVSIVVAKVMVKAYVTEVGYGPDEDVYEESYGSANIRTAPCVFAMGASREFLDGFTDEKIPDLIEAITDGHCKIDNRQKKRLVDRVKDIAETLSAEDQQKCSGYLGGRPADEQTSLPDADRCMVYEQNVEAQSEMEVTRLGSPELQEEFEKIENHRCIGDVEVDMSSGDISSDMIDDMGALIAGAHGDFMSRLEDDVATASAQETMDSHAARVALSMEAREKFAEKLLEKITEININNIDTYACAVPDFLAAGGIVTDEALLASSSQVVSCVNQDRKDRKSRTESGLPIVESEEAHNRESAAIGDVIDALANSTESDVVEFDDGSTVRKKRAAADTIDCDLIESLDLSATELSAEQLSSIESITDCIATLSKIEEWSPDQLAAIRGLLADIWGEDLSGWTTNNMIDTGTVMAAFSATEFADFEFNLDVLEVLGSYQVFSTEQLEVGFEKFLDGAAGSSLVSTDIISLGEFACGATTSVIAEMEPVEFSSAAASLGSTRACDADRLTAYISLAKNSDVFGPVGTWTEVDVETIGNMIGGITADELGSLGQAQVEAMSPSAVALIPPEILSGLTVDQVGFLSSTQLEAITEEQQMQLSEEILDALAANGGTVEVNGAADADDGGDGADAANAVAQASTEPNIEAGATTPPDVANQDTNTTMAASTGNTASSSLLFLSCLLIFSAIAANLK